MPPLSIDLGGCDSSSKWRSPAVSDGCRRLAGAGGGTTLPGKAPGDARPRRVDALAARLERGLGARLGDERQDDDVRAGRADARAARRSWHGTRPARTSMSGVASTLVAARGADLGLFEVDEAALPEVARRVRPRVVSLGNLFRDQLDRYGELEIVAERWRAMIPELPADAVLAVNADDPLVGDLASEHARSVTFGVDDPAQARSDLQHAADSKYCLRCGTPYDYAAAYVGHLGDYRCPACGHARPALDVAARRIELRGTEGASFDLVTPEGTRRVELALPGLYNVYNALAAATLTRALGVDLDAIAEGLGRAVPAFGRFERIELGGRTLLVLLIKNPAGANEALRTVVSAGAPQAGARRAERRDRGRPRRVVDLGRRLRAARSGPRTADRVGRPGRRARASLQVRRSRRRRRSRSSPTSRRRSIAGSS